MEEVCNMEISLNEGEFLAFKVSQPFGEFYTVRLNAKYLLKRSYTKSADYNGLDMSGAQRKINRKRLTDIGQFIDSDEALFPNSIIIAANYDRKDFLVEEDLRWKVEEINAEQGIYKLIIPSDSKVSSIVDGQHRLFGFEYSDRDDMELNCSIYLDLPPSFQASVFATVNFNQSAVDKSLAYNLFGYQLDNLDPKDWSPDLLAVNLCRYFSETSNEFFFNHINYRLAKRNVPQRYWVISTASFVDGLMSLISDNPKEDRYLINKKATLGVMGRKALDDYEDCPLRLFYINGNDEAIRQVVSGFFTSVRSVFELDDTSTMVLVKTIGISALFLLLKQILIENRSSINNTLIEKFPELLSKAKIIDFSNTDFYASSSKGKNRLLYMLKHTVLDIPFDSLNIKDMARSELQEEIDRFKG